jgi:hypothetical protein
MPFSSARVLADSEAGSGTDCRSYHFNGSPLLVVVYDADGSFVERLLLSDVEDPDGCAWAEGITVLPQGDVVVAGGCLGLVDTSVVELDCVGGRSLIVRVSESAPEAIAWHVFPDSFLTTDVGSYDDDVLLTGFFGGAVDLGGGSLEAEDGELFVARVSSDGEHRWSRRLGHPFVPRSRLAVTADGGVVVTGSFMNRIELGEHTLDSACDGGVFVLALGP